MFKYLGIKNSSKGFTLIEALIAIIIFTIVAVGVYSAYSNVLDITISSQLNATGLTVMANELEVMRNIRYQDIGTQGGAPSGIIPAEKNINFSGFDFILKTTVRNFDDPFDGILGGTPNDTAPADYKIIELELSCSNCARFVPIKTTTTIAPANLESSSRNGNLFINAIDASGEPIAGANVTVVNNSVSPAINISDVTNSNGQLQLVDIATSSLGYQITVTKSGYSTDRTYQPGAPSNPSPVKPHATVATQQVTLITFSIDRFSTQTLNTRNKFCQAVPNIDFSQQGAKLIGVDPDVLKYSVNDQTNQNGTRVNTGIEWDTYSIQNVDANYDLAGNFLLAPFNVNPNTNYSVNWLMEPKSGSSVLVVVQDEASQSINGADISLTKAGFSETKVSGHNYFDQTDWSGGQFYNKSQNIDELSPAGEVKLRQIDGKYASMSLEWLESQTFDMGAVANFYNFKWNPASQPVQTGTDSLKFQIAANNDNATWNYVGPDGTSGTYYTNPDSSVNSVHNGNRYFRYKAYLMTEDHFFTPNLEDINVEFSSSCLPSGQSFFSGLADDAYTLTIQKAGYQIYTVPLNILNGWQEFRAVLIP